MNSQAFTDASLARDRRIRNPDLEFHRRPGLSPHPMGMLPFMIPMAISIGHVKEAGSFGFSRAISPRPEGFALSGGRPPMRFLSFWLYQKAVGNPPQAPTFVAAHLLPFASPCGRGSRKFLCFEAVSRGSDVPPDASPHRVCRLGCYLPSILSDRPVISRFT